MPRCDPTIHRRSYLSPLTPVTARKTFDDRVMTPPLGFNGCDEWTLLVEFQAKSQPISNTGIFELATIRLQGPNPYA